MRRARHISEQRSEILRRVKGGERSVGEVAQEQGMKNVNTGDFIEVPATPARATVVEL